MPPSVLGGRIIAPGDPMWTQDDTDLALALAEIDAERCPGCGHPRSESMDPGNEFAFKSEPVRCHACASRDRATRSADDSLDFAGINWITTRSDDGG